MTKLSFKKTGDQTNKKTKRQNTGKRKQTTQSKKKHKKETRTDPNKQRLEKHKFQKSDKFHKIGFSGIGYHP